MKLRVLDLFSGAGMFSLGLERTGGFETVAFCEIDPYARAVLRNHWPKVPIYEDVTTAGFVGPVDLVTAGFPCQDISHAGQGAGLSGGRSGLFWHVLRAASMVGQPRLLLENVAALLHRGMGTVLGALAQSGYDAQWDCIQACDAGEPHRRSRVFITAHANGLRELQPGWGIHDKRRWAIHRIQETLQSYADNDGSRSDAVTTKRMDLCGNGVTAKIPEMIGRAILETYQ
jgi:DNA (cytosine-5)-methyltransferase 1